MGITDDPNDPRLTHGFDDTPRLQAEVYLVLSAEERAKGFVRPVRRTYIHDNGETPCGAVTSMGLVLAETYASDPTFYGSTFCCACSKHRPVREFHWDGTDELVGS